MTDSSEDKKHMALILALEKIKAPLDALAILKLADEFYTKEERKRVYAEFAELRAADLAAYEVMVQACESGKGTAEQTSAFEAKKGASLALDQLEKEHPLILRLLDARSILCK